MSNTSVKKSVASDTAALPDYNVAAAIKPTNWVNVGAWVVLVLIALSIAINVVTNERWKWNIVFTYLFDPLVLQGLGRTILLTIVAGVVGLVGGLVIGLMNMSQSNSLRVLALSYIGFIRAIPALVLILVLYFISALFPTIDFGIPFLPPIVQIPTNSILSQFGAAMLGLAMIVAGHTAEIIRGGIMSVSKGQTEAARALSIPRSQAFARIVLPQAVRVTIPPFATELITLFKNTSLVSVIGYAELLTVVQNIYGRTYETLPLLTVACIWYLLLTILAMIGQSRLEKRFGRGFQSR
ncbi:amino acid ABC transporter permease [uncultured Microbacterium sp.]|uniref:amino acid ABC transporter permease n=1 Tax=uncultured Microbacterium sp. TaxID=191216 RepID=UPI002613C291|nr:amino acid ABC transporter permease [uncultured Microbacterium sp.]